MGCSGKLDTAAGPLSLFLRFCGSRRSSSRNFPSPFRRVSVTHAYRAIWSPLGSCWGSGVGFWPVAGCSFCFLVASVPFRVRARALAGLVLGLCPSRVRGTFRSAPSVPAVPLASLARGFRARPCWACVGVASVVHLHRCILAGLAGGWAGAPRLASGSSRAHGGAIVRAWRRSWSFRLARAACAGLFGFARAPALRSHHTTERLHGDADMHVDVYGKYARLARMLDWPECPIGPNDFHALLARLDSLLRDCSNTFTARLIALVPSSPIGSTRVGGSPIAFK